MKNLTTHSILNSNRGSVLFLTVLGIGALSAIVALLVFARAETLAKTGFVYRAQLDNAQVKHELEVVFANPTLCKNRVKLSGSTFSVAGVYAVSSGSQGVGETVVPLSMDNKMGVKQMVVENITPIGGILYQADFSIVTQIANDNGTLKTHKNTVTAIYSADGAGNITDCRIAVPAQKACEDLGFTWQTATNRCGICERLGGSWASSACSLVNGGQNGG